MESSYPKGSEWRKWDLHVHTPFSIYQQYGANDAATWESYIKDLEKLPGDFAVLGINDYLFLDGYRKLKAEQQNGRLQNIRLLPVVEFRIDKFAGVDFGQLKRINLHVIFSDELQLETIQSQFLNTLEQSYYLADSGNPWTRAITPESVAELGAEIKAKIPPEQLGKYGSDLTEGFNNLNIKEDAIFEKLQKDCFKDKYLVAIGKTEWCDLKWTDASIATKKSIINRADIVFTAAESVEAFQKSKEHLVKQEVNNNLLDCSDAHYFSTHANKDRIGNCFTWIKADPTFEGLKQIKYEPEERVKIQTTNPSLDFDKPCFLAINIVDDEVIFTDEDDLMFEKRASGLPLNQNLVAVIGGRGEGKSMLTDYLASSFVGQRSSKDGIFQKTGNINVEYSKTNQKEDENLTFFLTKEQHAIDFIYINQGRLKNIVEVKERSSNLADSIRKLAKLHEQNFSKELNDHVMQSIYELHELNEFFATVDDEGNLINSIDYIKSEEQSIKEFIDNITTEENRDKLSRYSDNLQQLNDLTSKKDDLTKLQARLGNTISAVNADLNKVSGDDTQIPLLTDDVFAPQIIAIDNWLSSIDGDISGLNQTISHVKDEFKDYKGDLSTLLKDIDKFQRSLFDIQHKLKNVTEKNRKLEAIKKTLFSDSDDGTSLVSKIHIEYKSQKQHLLDEWATFNKIEERDDLNLAQKDIMKALLSDLSIDAMIHFDEKKFYDEMFPCINGGVWRVKNNRDAQKEWFKIDDIDTFFKFIKERYLSASNDSSFYKEPFTRLFFDEAVRSKYIRVFPVLKYKGRDLNRISVGQKGTVYLKMMLATEAFSKPIIFDQPEDDLDNEFIMDELIDLFKSLKKYRQVIIVTHNANLVVNADAEQIIIAKNDKGRLSYFAGSLENEGINANICKILEGGKSAFEKRRNKYQH